MTHSAVAANAAELPAAELAAGAARQWAQLLPVGAINGRDGRRFRLSRPAALVEAFRRDPRPLPVDYEHASAASRTTGAPAPAAGWITDLKVAENAIWGLIEWNEKARAMVAAREYRFLSPEFLYDPASGEVRALLSAGLVHRPNLALAALNRQEAADMTPPRTEDDALRIPAAVLEALRLPNDTDVEAALAAIATLREAADPEKVVPVAAMRELLAERNAKVDRLAEREADAKVEAAVAGGYLTPAMRPWATALCRQAPASFDEFMNSTAPPWAHILKPAPMGRLAASAHAESRAGRDDDAARIARQLGLDPRDLEGA